MPVSQECLDTDQGVEHVCTFLMIFTQLETRTTESKMCAIFLGVSRDTTHAVDTGVQVSRESHPSRTNGERRRAVDCL